MRATVNINTDKIKYNAAIILKTCHDVGIDVAAVTKMHSADINICSALLESGVKYLADSRIENIAYMSENGIDAEKWLMRIVAPSIVPDVVKYADMSFNSDISTIRLLNDEANRQGKKHKIMLMWDLGDLREGYFETAHLLSCVRDMKDLDGVELSGLGTNLSCYGGVKPTRTNLTRLVEVASMIENETGRKLDHISGGNSTSYSLILEGNMPEGITNLRIGDSFYFGRDVKKREYIPGMKNDCFILEGEVVEVKIKPSVPIGERGYAALNSLPEFEDRGMIKRAIISVGKQDIDLDMTPIDEGALILGASSDHLLVDVTDCTRDIKVGDKMQFNMLYTATMRSFTSKYIDKRYINE
ncbi:MAG: alanine/ornithine racemase family PLP-dependent enzyme [Anaerofustis stercorihominis]|nr:alanine/ornithine racemase family PLP-dependent enzyme [Anaerofustis stercorihominis]